MSNPFVRLAGAASLAACLALGQFQQATVFGTVSDSTGAAVPAATVIITSVATGAVATTQSSQEGFYSVPNLAVGEYHVAAEKTGFKRVVRSGSTLRVAQSAQLDMT